MVVPPLTSAAIHHPKNTIIFIIIIIIIIIPICFISFLFESSASAELILIFAVSDQPTKQTIMDSMRCEESKNDEKICGDCKTSKTPLWRNGPAGPKSLCNACGIRFRKKKTTIETSNNKQPQSPTSSSSSSTNIHNNNKKNDCEGPPIKNKKGGKLRLKLVTLGKQVGLLQRQRSPMKKIKRRKMDFKNFRYYGEVEQAAFLLMSLSCGSVFG